MDDRIGQHLGNYRLNSLIGQGGFGEVYLAEHIHLGTLAAIKILGLQLGSDEIVRFRNEARTIARLLHPNIVRVFDFGVDEGVPFLVMDYAPNGTVAQRHPKGTIVPFANIVTYVKQIASALQYAHDQRIIHRDVKPQNMFFDSNNEILLGDFGIAIPASDSSVQSTGEVRGTATYMAPEQIQGKPQLASDQYALGVTVYQWLCGEFPYSGNFIEILQKHLFVPPPSLREKGATVSPAVEAVVLKALSKDPGQRYARIMDFADALEQAASPAASKSSNIPVGSSDREEQAVSSDSDEFATRSHAPASPPQNLEDGGLDEYEVADDFFVPYYGTATPSLQENTQPTDATSHAGDLEEEASKQPGIPTLEVPPQIQITQPASSTLLFTQSVSSQTDLRDFFIMYTKADRKWARWVAWELEEANYSVILSPWYLHSQSNFDMEMEKAATKAKRTVIILSPDSLNILKAQPMHIAMLQRELTYNQNKLLSICVRECGSEHEHLLDSLHHIDIAGEDEFTAQAILLASIQDEGISLTMHPAFPDTNIRRSLEAEPTFPPDNPTMTQGQFSGTISFNPMASHTLPLTLPNIEIFFSYSHQDKKLRNELEKFMSHLKRHPSIKSWHDGEIGAGMAWAQEIDTHLNKANIILLLVSQDFIASNYCYDIEMQKAIQRHEAGEARVIPIILSPAFWENTPIGQLQVLPTGATPIKLWKNRNLALMDVVKGIQRAIEQLASKV